MGHKRKDCFERQRKVLAKFNNANIAPDEFEQPNLALDYDGKRDRYVLTLKIKLLLLKTYFFKNIIYFSINYLLHTYISYKIGGQVMIHQNTKLLLKNIKK